MLRCVPRNERNIGLVSQSALALSAFTSELYLKCLLCVETGNAPATHNLKNLFDALQLLTKREFDDLWDGDIRRPENQLVIAHLRTLPAGKTLRLDLRYALDVGANSFMDLRYFYETERAYFLLTDFPNLLRKVILKRFPAWQSALPKPAIGLIR